MLAAAEALLVSNCSRGNRIDFYRLTGSTVVGQRIANQTGTRQSSLELGGIAATILCDDTDVAAMTKRRLTIW
jgi:acyl-CoA reductase-like NAD-dependent aldehyde dehydrogenase|tara:strand:+ start:308 stop:526 length:219 start_codon:yes stop_codon:yes gene_type:complete